MDFVPAPYNTSIPPLEVPFVATTLRDFYDELQRYDDLRSGFLPSFISLPRYLAGEDTSDEGVASWLQSWLCFGLLSVFSKRDNLDGLSTRGTRWEQIVDSKVLAVDAITRSIRHMPHSIIKSRVSVIDSAIRVVREIEDQLPHVEILNVILLSIKILLSFLNSEFSSEITSRIEHESHISDLAVMHPSYPPAPRSFRDDPIHISRLARYSLIPIPTRSEPPSNSAAYLRDKMLERGWCIHQVHKIFRTFSYHVAYYFYRLSRHTALNVQHGKCARDNSDKCVAWTINSRHFAPQHYDVHCMCSSISVPTETIATIIRKGGIPILSLSRDRTGRLSLEVSKWNSRVAYVAISHVLADGLGNPHENGLPRCQLNRIFELLEQIPGVIKRKTSALSCKGQRRYHFWLDTMCIPVDDGKTPDHNEVKNLAIQRMSTVYGHARTTIVLDAELRKLEAQTGFATIFAHIYCCGWATRGWTLQEQSLAKSCSFAFLDRIVDLKARFKKAHPNTYASPLRELLQDWKASQLGIWDEKALLEDSTYERNFATIWNSLLERATGQPQDVPAILASLLGLNAYNVLKEDASLRIQAIISSLDYIPFSFLYKTGGENFAESTQTPEEQHLPITDVTDLSGTHVQFGSRQVQTPIEADKPRSSQRKKSHCFPSCIQGERLISGPQLRIAKNSLILCRQALRQTDACITTDELPQGPFTIQDTRNPSVRLLVKPRLQEGNECDHMLNPTLSHARCFILDDVLLKSTEGQLVRKGVQLVVDREANKTMYTRFECAIAMVHFVEAQEDADIPQVHASPLPPNSKVAEIVIEIENFGPRIPRAKERPAGYGFTTKLFLALGLLPLVPIVIAAYLVSQRSPGSCKNRVLELCLLAGVQFVVLALLLLRPRFKRNLFIQGCFRESRPDRHMLVRLGIALTHYFDHVVSSLWSYSLVFLATFFGGFSLMLRKC